jgi:hypothetical protein
MDHISSNYYAQLVQGFEAARETYSEHANNVELGNSTVSSSEKLFYSLMALSGLIAKAGRTMSSLISQFRMCVTRRIPLGGRGTPYVLDVLIDRYLFEDVVFSEEFADEFMANMLMGNKELIIKHAKLLTDVMTWGRTVRPEHVNRCHAEFNPRCPAGASHRSSLYTDIRLYMWLKNAYGMYVGSRRRLCQLQDLSRSNVAFKTFRGERVNVIERAASLASNPMRRALEYL